MKTLFFLAFTVSTLNAALSTRIEWTIEPTEFLQDRLGLPLSAGTGAAGDGTLLELGYYSSATNINPFSGSWITLFNGTMGDKNVGINGQFELSDVFFDTDPLIEPTVGTPLSIRFYDAPTIDGSTYYNAVSNTSGDWGWLALSDPQSVIDMEIAKGAVVWQDDVPSAFRTTILIPELSAIWLLISCFAGALIWRRIE